MLEKLSSFFRGLVGYPPHRTETEPIPAIRSDEEHNSTFKEGARLINPYMHLHDVPARSAMSPDAQRDLRRGITLLGAVVSYAPGNWNAFWIIGKAFQALRDHANAYDAFKHAYYLQQVNTDVAREYMFTCLELGLGKEGVHAAQHAISLRPNEAGLHANLALACLIAGDLTDAKSAIERSLTLDPADIISNNLKARIQEVTDGKRPQPRKYSELLN